MNGLQKVVGTGKKFLSFIHEKLLPNQHLGPPSMGPGRFLPSGGLWEETDGGQEIVLVCIDHSGSMGDSFHPDGSRLEAAKAAGAEMVRRKAEIDPGDEMGAVVFASGARILCPLMAVGKGRRRIIRTIRGIQVDGGTDMGQGLWVCQSAFQDRRRSRVRARERLVLLTDGHAVDNPMPAAQALKKDGVIIDTIGIGEHPSHVDEKTLKEIASVIDGKVRYRFIRDREELVQHFGSLATKIAKIGR